MSLSDTHHTDESDVALIERSRAGDVGAFEVLHARHVGSAQALARRMSRSAADADDLVSEGFARVLSALQRGKGPDVAFRPYLLSTIRRLAYDRSSREQREAPVVTDDGPEVALPVGDPVVDGFERDTAAAAFASLPERWRMVLWHTEVEGQSPAEVGALLGMNPNAVAALAYRAREGLRQAYLTEHAPRASSSKECELTTSRLGAYVRGGLTPSREVRLRKHLDECGDCQAAYLELASVNTAMPAIVVFAVLGPVGGAYLASVIGPSVTATAALIAGMSPLVDAGAGAGATAAAAGATAATAGAAGATGATAGATSGAAGSTASAAARTVANARHLAAAAAVVVVIAAVAALAAFGGDDPSTSTATPAPDRAAAPSDVEVAAAHETAPAPAPTTPVADDPAPNPPSSPVDRFPTTLPGSSNPDRPFRSSPFTPPTRRPSTPPPSTPARPVPTTTAPVTTVPTTTAPTTTTTEPPKTTTTEPPLPPNLAVQVESAGVLVRGRPGVIVARVTNAAGGPASQAGLRIQLTGAQLRGLPQTPSGLRGTSAVRGAASADDTWSCEGAGPTELTCTSGSVAADGSATLYVPVLIADDASPVHIEALVSGESLNARPGPATITTLPVEASGMAARFATVDRGAIATAGNTLLTCDPLDPRCESALAGGPGALDNGSFTMVPVDVDDDPATANSSGADLTLSPDAEVLSATLYWSAGLAAGPGGTPAPAPALRDRAVLTGPDGVGHAIVAERVDTIPADQRYQAVADVTEQVRRGGTGAWTLGGAQIGTGTNTYGGWSLVVAYRDATLPRRSLVVLDGFAAVNDSQSVSFTVGGFLVPTAGSTGATLDIVAYEGDTGLAGDQLSVNGVDLVDDANPLGNSFNSSSADRGRQTPGGNPSWGNLLGIDLDRFDVTHVLSPGSTSTTITFSTAADRYLTGAVAVAIDQ